MSQTSSGRAVSKSAKPAARSLPVRILRAVFVYVGVPYLAIVALAGVFQRSLIYHPSKIADLQLEESVFKPHRVENVEVVAGDGTRLRGGLVESAFVPRVEGEPAMVAPLVIYCPGNAGNRKNRTDDLREIADLGVDALLVDYRGYEDSEGSPSAEAIATDMRGVWEFAMKRPRYRADRTALFGESLGGAIATRLCSELCAEGKAPAGLIVVSSFASLGDVAAGHYPFLPVRLLLVDRFASADFIKRVTCPIAIAHGDQDTIVPFEQGQKLFAAAPEKSAGGVAKYWSAVSGMGHNDLPASTLTELVQRVLQVKE